MAAMTLAVAAVATLAASATAAGGHTMLAGTVPGPGSGARWLFSPAEIVRLKRNVRVNPAAKLAWQKALASANEALSATPHPADPHADYRDRGDPSCPPGSAGWYCGLYLPGLEDGRNARALAIAYVITGDRRYAMKAKEILLAWARTYTPLPSPSMIGHYIAEVGGITLKSFEAYALVQDAWSPGDRQTFVRWASMFVDRGKRQADAARDEPWVPQAPWGNSATWARSMAVLAAAVVGGKTLRNTLAWNWAHTTAAGKDYGWRALIDGVMYPGGKMVEEDVRQSIFYAMFTLQPLMMIADVARHVGYRHNLWTYHPTASKGILVAVSHYAPYLMGQANRFPSYSEPTGRTSADIAAANRSVLESAANAVPTSTLLRRIVSYGGPDTRGSNYDPYIVAFNAVTAGIGSS